ncbi:MAG: molybdopterin-dependent oxidoreductase [Desulfovibrionaceae bacterium]|nr:molybdopterin-dependent oxidoreductase [Desulfovibrionaceae bacterium]
MRSNSVLAKKQLSGKTHDAVIFGVCGQCPAGCGLKVFRNAQTAIDFFGDEEHPMNKGALCPKAMYLYEVQKQPLRLQKPCIRKSLQDPWQEVSWDRALDEAAERLAALPLAADGTPSIIFPASSHDPFDYCMGATWCAYQAPSVASPAAFFPPALGTEGRLAAMFGLPGAQLAMNPPRDWATSRAILLVGGDVAAEEPICFGPLQDARDRGSALLYLGAAGGMTALRSSEAMLVRPGTESLALAGLVHIILNNDWIDAAFLAEQTIGLAALKEQVKACSPDRVAEGCGIAREQLERYAHILGHAFPIQVQTAFPGQAPWLDDALLTLCGALAVLRGSIGVPGGGCNLHGVSPFRDNRHMLSGQALPPMTPEQALSSGRVRAAFGFGDWASRLAGGETVRKRLAACELLVHIGCYDNATRRLAHISLPAAHWSEYECLMDVNSGRAVQWRNALLKPLGENRPPLDIWTDLARRLNPTATPPWETKPFAEESSAQRRLASYALASNPFTRGITLSDLGSGQPSGGALWPCPEGCTLEFERSRYIRGTVRGRNILFAANTVFPGSRERFPTPDGKIHLESAVAPTLRADAPAPAALALILRQEAGQVTNQPGASGNSGEACTLRLHPETAQELGLGTGQKVRVTPAASATGTGVDSRLQITWSAPKGGAVLEPEDGAALIPAEPDALGPVAVTLHRI